MLKIIISIADNTGPLERSYSRLRELHNKNRNRLWIQYMETQVMIGIIKGAKFDYELARKEIKFYCMIWAFEICHLNLISFEISFCSLFHLLKRFTVSFFFGLTNQQFQKILFLHFSLFIKGKYFGTAIWGRHMDPGSIVFESVVTSFHATS